MKYIMMLILAMVSLNSIAGGMFDSHTEQDWTNDIEAEFAPYASAGAAMNIITSDYVNSTWTVSVYDTENLSRQVVITLLFNAANGFHTDTFGLVLLTAFFNGATAEEIAQLVKDHAGEEETAKTEPETTAYVLLTATLNGLQEKIMLYIDLTTGRPIGKPMVLQFFDETHNWNDRYDTIYIDLKDLPEDTKVLMTSLPKE